MPIPKSSWKGYAAGAIVIWAVGLQVFRELHMPSTVNRSIDCCLLQWTLFRSTVFALQVSMWSLQKKPEFKQKFPELVDEPRQPEVSPCQAIDMFSVYE